MKRVMACFVVVALLLLAFIMVTANAQDQQQIKNEIRKHQEAIINLEHQLRSLNKNSAVDYENYSAGESVQNSGDFLLEATPAKLDKDNNPPGPKGGPGTNWENPAGPKGGAGASPN